MRNTPPSCYYHSTIINFIKEKINRENITSFADLDDHDKDRLTVLCMDQLGSDAAECMLLEYDPENIMIHLKEYLNKGKCNTYDLMEIMRNSAIKSVEHYMDMLFVDLARNAA